MCTILCRSVLCRTARTSCHICRCFQFKLCCSLFGKCFRSSTSWPRRAGWIVRYCCVLLTFQFQLGEKVMLFNYLLEKKNFQMNFQNECRMFDLLHMEYWSIRAITSKVIQYRNAEVLKHNRSWWLVARATLQRKCKLRKGSWADLGVWSAGNWFVYRDSNAISSSSKCDFLIRILSLYTELCSKATEAEWRGTVIK